MAELPARRHPSFPPKNSQTFFEGRQHSVVTEKHPQDRPRGHSEHRTETIDGLRYWTYSADIRYSAFKSDIGSLRCQNELGILD
jgi:hypothetical protein